MPCFKHLKLFSAERCWVYLLWQHPSSALHGEVSAVSCSWGPPALSLLTHVGTRPHCWAKRPGHPCASPGIVEQHRVMSNIPPDGREALGTLSQPLVPTQSLPCLLPMAGAPPGGFSIAPIPSLALAVLHSPGPSLGLFSSSAKRKVSSAPVSLGAAVCSHVLVFSTGIH